MPEFDNLNALEYSFTALSLLADPEKSLFVSIDPSKRAEFILDGGKAESISLLKKTGVSVAITRVVLDKGKDSVIWSRHHHSESECLILHSGSFKLYVCSIKDVLKLGACSPEHCIPETCERAKRYDLVAPMCFHIESESIHSAIFDKESEFIAVSIPDSESFPGEIQADPFEKKK